MDAKEFIKERNRMCKSFGDLNCDGCPINDILRCSDLEHFNPEMVDAVEKWSKEHPLKTNRDALKEKFGTIMFSADGYFTLKHFLINNMSIEDWLNSEYKEPEVKK